MPLAMTTFHLRPQAEDRFTTGRPQAAGLCTAGVLHEALRFAVAARVGVAITALLCAGVIARAAVTMHLHLTAGRLADGGCCYLTSVPAEAVRKRSAAACPSLGIGHVALRTHCARGPRGPGNFVPAPAAIHIGSDLLDPVTACEEAAAVVGDNIIAATSNSNAVGPKPLLAFTVTGTRIPTVMSAHGVKYPRCAVRYTSRTRILRAVFLTAGSSAEALASRTRPARVEDGLHISTPKAFPGISSTEPFGANTTAIRAGLRGLAASGPPYVADTSGPANRGTGVRCLGLRSFSLVLGFAATPVLTGVLADAALTTPLGLYRAALPSCGGAAPRD